jgi:hypothetical protein
VLTGSSSREELERVKAPVILDTIAGLLPLVGAGAGDTPTGAGGRVE